MESLIAIGVGLVLRVVVDITTDNDERIGGVVIGLWEGVVLNHFLRRQPRSFDPYIGVGFRIFVDFLFTQSLSRFALVVIWAVLGMLLADVAPYVWRDSGLRRLYRHVRRDVRHVKRAVPRIRIKNDLPSVSLFKHSRSSSSTVVSGSIRSDRAAPSRSPAPPPAPEPGPSRRPGRSPPGTFPGASGWSEIGSDITDVRHRVATNPGPSPALIPSREHADIAHVDATHVVTSRTRTTTHQDTTITVAQTEKAHTVVEAAAIAVAASATVAAVTPDELMDDPSRHDPPTIPDDWITVTQPTPVPQPLPEPNSEFTPKTSPALGPSIITFSRPASVLDPPPVLDVLPDIPDFDFDRASRVPEEVPLPESRPASVIGGVFDQPQPRSVVRENALGLVDRATSELGVAPSKNSFASFIPAPFSSLMSHTRTLSTSSRTKSKLQNSIDIEAPKVHPKGVTTQPEPVVERKTESVGGKSNVDDAAQRREPPLPTPAEVDPPASVLTRPADPSPPSKPPESAPTPAPASKEQEQQQPLTNEPDPLHADGGDVDVDPTLRSGTGEGANTAPSKKNSLFDVPMPSRSPPPPFSEFAGVPDGPAAGEAPAEEDPVTQDQGDAPTELTPEQKAAEEKRHAFLLTQVKSLQDARDRLQSELNDEDNPDSKNARTIKKDLDDHENTLDAIKVRLAKTKFSERPQESPVPEITLTAKSATEVQYAIASAIVKMILAREDAGPITIQGVINKSKQAPKGRAKEGKDALIAFAKLHKFAVKESTTPGIINITF